MGLKMIDAILASRLEPRLRFLAVILAKFASDGNENPARGPIEPIGVNVWPGAETVSHAIGANVRTVREGLEALLLTGILVKDGFHGHARRYKFDVERLATYKPPADRRRDTWRSLKPKDPKQAHTTSTGIRQPCASAHGSITPQPCASAHRYDPETVIANGVRARRQPCAVAPLRVRERAAHKEEDQEDHENPYTGAVAPAFSEAGKTAEPEKAAPDCNVEVIEQIATDILNTYPEIPYEDQIETVKNRCANFKIPYRTAIVQRALDAAIAQRKATYNHAHIPRHRPTRVR